MDLESLSTWIGREQHARDCVTAAPVAALAATLDRDEPPAGPGQPLPPLWHWLYFLPQTAQRGLGPDGHARRGGFLPPVPLPRRMWAGGRLEFHQPLTVGEQIERHSRVQAVQSRRGRSGALVFVTVAHAIHGGGGLALTEAHDIVYRAAPPAEAAAAVPDVSAAAAAAPGTAAAGAPGRASFEREIRPDPVLLFRYSALTFNGHRIHYDRRFCTEVEGYPGLVVHGPLIATLLLELLRVQPGAGALRRFEFKALRPLFDTHPFTVCGRFEGPRHALLWACDHAGALALQARAELA